MSLKRELFGSGPEGIRELFGELFGRAGERVIEKMSRHEEPTEEETQPVREVAKVPSAVTRLEGKVDALGRRMDGLEASQMTFLQGVKRLGESMSGGGLNSNLGEFSMNANRVSSSTVAPSMPEVPPEVRRPAKFGLSIDPSTRWELSSTLGVSVTYDGRFTANGRYLSEAEAQDAVKSAKATLAQRRAQYADGDGSVGGTPSGSSLLGKDVADVAQKLSSSVATLEEVTDSVRVANDNETARDSVQSQALARVEAYLEDIYLDQERIRVDVNSILQKVDGMSGSGGGSSSAPMATRVAGAAVAGAAGGGGIGAGAALGAMGALVGLRAAAGGVMRSRRGGAAPSATGARAGSSVSTRTGAIFAAAAAAQLIYDILQLDRDAPDYRNQVVRLVSEAVVTYGISAVAATMAAAIGTAFFPGMGTVAGLVVGMGGATLAHYLIGETNETRAAEVIADYTIRAIELFSEMNFSLPSLPSSPGPSPEVQEQNQNQHEDAVRIDPSTAPMPTQGGMSRDFMELSRELGREDSRISPRVRADLRRRALAARGNPEQLEQIWRELEAARSRGASASQEDLTNLASFTEGDEPDATAEGGGYGVGDPTDIDFIRQKSLAGGSQTIAAHDYTIEARGDVTFKGRNIIFQSDNIQSRDAVGIVNPPIAGEDIYGNPAIALSVARNGARRESDEGGGSGGGGGASGGGIGGGGGGGSGGTAMGAVDGRGGGGQISEREVYDYFIDKGWPPHVAAGMVANLIVESGLRPGARGDNGQAHGLAQWTPSGGRRQNVERYLGVEPGGLGALPARRHLDAIYWELTQTGEARNLQAILASPDAASAAEAIDRLYERSDGRARGTRRATAARVLRDMQRAGPDAERAEGAAGAGAAPAGSEDVIRTSGPSPDGTGAPAAPAAAPVEAPPAVPWAPLARDNSGPMTPEESSRIEGEIIARRVAEAERVQRAQAAQQRANEGADAYVGTLQGLRPVTPPPATGTELGAQGTARDVRRERRGVAVPPAAPAAAPAQPAAQERRAAIEAAPSEVHPSPGLMRELSNAGAQPSIVRGPEEMGIGLHQWGRPPVIG
jgi:uncharacterized membrane protein YgcG